MASRVVFPQSRIQEQRRKRRAWMTGGYMLLSICFVGGLIALSWIPQWRVSIVEVTGTQIIATSSVVGYVQNELVGRDIYLFPKNNVLWYPKQEIIASLPVEFPMLQSASIELQNLHTIVVHVSERSAQALWCGEQMATGTPCYLLDGSGLLYTLAANYSSNVYIDYYGPAAQSVLPRQYLEPAQFESLSALVAAFGEKEATDSIQSVSVDATGNTQVVFASGFVLMFTLSQNPSDLLNRFSLALTTALFTAHPLSNFSYLDMRFGDKLYYKLKGQ